MPYYICSGAKLKCSMGSAQSTLAVMHSANPVLLNGKPMANNLDRTLLEVASFGMCKSLANPTVATATAAANGKLQEMPCIPNIVLPAWVGCKNSVAVKGSGAQKRPALTNKSKVTCIYAGQIEITDAGQNFVTDDRVTPESETAAAKTEEKKTTSQITEQKIAINNNQLPSQKITAVAIGAAAMAGVAAMAVIAGKTGGNDSNVDGKTEKDNKEETEECLCEAYNLIWGNKVNCEFRKKVVEISKELWPDDYLSMANNLMAVFAWESGGTFKAGVPNLANSGATGLIQFMPSTAKSLLGKEVTIEYTEEFWGKKLKRVKEFAEMTEVRQLDYVKKYFEPLKNKKLEFVDFYLRVLFPASSLKEDHIVFADSLEKITTRLTESESLKNLRVTAYSQNSGLDSNKDGVVWKNEIKEKVQKYVTQGESNRATEFECSKMNAAKSA